MSIALGVIALCALPTLAQAQATMNPEFKERVTNPLRNTPAGREPQHAPGEAIILGSTGTQQCRSKLDEATATVANWAVSARKTKAEKELESARVAIRGDDPRTCNAHIQAALSAK
jgi:hypothetical protein